MCLTLEQESLISCLSSAGDDTVGVFVNGLADFLFGGTGFDTLVLDGKFCAAGVTNGLVGTVTPFTLNNASVITGTAA